jgi:hypothetical protein
VHVLDWSDPQLALPLLPVEIRSARELVDGAEVAFRQTDRGVVLTLPARSDHTIDQIIVLDLAAGNGR